VSFLHALLDVGGAGHVGLLFVALRLPLTIFLEGREGGSEVRFRKGGRVGGRVGGREGGEGRTSIWKAELETTRMGTPTPLVPGSDLP